MMLTKHKIWDIRIDQSFSKPSEKHQEEKDDLW